MDSIVQPQVEKFKIDIRKDLATRAEVLQEEQWIRVAWNLALQKLLPNEASALEVKSDRKRLEEVWNPFLVDVVVENYFREVLARVLGLSRSINWKKPFGIILFPSIWQAAVHHASNEDNTTGTTRAFQVTASDSDAKRLQTVLSGSAIRLCNERIIQWLQRDEIWNHPNLLAETIVPTFQRVVDEAYIKTLHFVDERGDFIVESAVVPVATYAMGKPSLDNFAHESMTHFEQTIRSTSTRSSPELASTIGSQTRTRCRDWIRSSEYSEQILPIFVRDELVPTIVASREESERRRGFLGRFRF
jgi:hypothetical protein